MRKLMTDERRVTDDSDMIFFGRVPLIPIDVPLAPIDKEAERRRREKDTGETYHTWLTLIGPGGREQICLAEDKSTESVEQEILRAIEEKRVVSFKVSKHSLIHVNAAAIVAFEVARRPDLPKLLSRLSNEQPYTNPPPSWRPPPPAPRDLPR
jgi:hypothetical protein